MVRNSDFQMPCSKQFKTALTAVPATLKRNLVGVFVSAMDFLNMNTQTLNMKVCLSLVRVQSKFFTEIK
jgi:hypothetical protein